MKKKVVCAMLVLSMTVSMTACGTESAGTGTAEDAEEAVDTEVSETETASDSGDYDEVSAAIYNSELGDFYEAYVDAKDNSDTVSERFAKMAVAEAKLMESAIMVPLNSLGGKYAIGRIAPYTIDYALWGNDYERFHSALVCTDFIKEADRVEMKTKWAELKGTGNYLDWAKSYLEEKGYTLKDSYNIPYNSDPTTWDCMATYLAADSDAIVNTFDSLMEYDCEGTLQPALAESYTVSDDGLTYTFHLRKGVAWVDSQGRQVAEVTADDFVAGMQHLLDAQAGMEYLTEGIIDNASEYISGEITDFSQVGVKAVDDYTLEYTLEEPCTYFMTMLGYSVFAPMNRSFYESLGGKFGSEYDASAADYTYGKDINSIAYCGPYLVTNATEKNTIVFKANESYWNYDNLNVKTITWLYNDDSDATKRYNDLKAGNIDSCSLNSACVTSAKADGLFDDYAYVGTTDATSYMGFYNLNRAAFANFNDDTTAVSTQTEEDAARTKAAMNNVHFRRAISFAFDRATYLAQDVGDDLKYASMRNTYTPANFVVLDEDTTIDINGTATTFPAGTYYGQIMQAQIDADGVKITVWNPEADDGNGSGDGYDGWYSVENAVEEMNLAIEELAAEGITIDAEHPIMIDDPYPSSSETYTNKANAYKKSLESALNGLVQVNLVSCSDLSEWYYAGYYATEGAECNYDMYDLSGWAPDYGDPQTYLDTFLPDYAGYCTKCLGIY